MAVNPAEDWGQFELVYSGSLVSALNPLPVTIVGGGGGGGGAVDVASVGGSAIELGATVAAASLPVVLATDATVVASTVPRASGGLSKTSNIMPNNTTAVVVKGSAGQVYAIEAFNNSATIAYLKIYNATSATAGAGTPALRIMIPANSGVSLVYENGDAYSTGITFIVTTGIADNDTGAPAANVVIVNFHYN